jgi:prevent-host-death family protein
MRHIDATEARRSFARLYAEVAYGGERIVIDHHGKGLVALVPIAHLDAPARTPAPRSGEAPNRDHCIARLQQGRPWLHHAGVRHAAIFGSVARNEAGPDSDVDVLVEFGPGASIDLFGFAALRERLAAEFGRRVDLVSKGALIRERDQRVLEEAVYAF